MTYSLDELYPIFKGYHKMDNSNIRHVTEYDEYKNPIKQNSEFASANSLFLLIRKHCVFPQNRRRLTTLRVLLLLAAQHNPSKLGFCIRSAASVQHNANKFAFCVRLARFFLIRKHCVFPQNRRRLSIMQINLPSAFGLHDFS